MGQASKGRRGSRAVSTSDSAVLRTLPDAIFLVGRDGQVFRYLGGAADDHLLQPDELEGRNIREAWPADVADRLVSEVRRVLKSREPRGFCGHISDKAPSSEYEMRLSAQGRDQVLLVVRAVNSGINGDGERGGDKASGKSDADAITGLISREKFLSRFDALVADATLRERGVAVFCIDINHFTRINETFGRPVGDDVLRIAAQRIDGCLRSSDTLARIEDSDTCSLTRISGDEFVLVIADIDCREDAGAVAARVRNAFEAPFAIGEQRLDITLSIGIAVFPQDGDNVDELLKNAHVALDEAKLTSSEGREFFSDTMRFRAHKRLDVGSELEWAIERDQFRLHYLPRIDLETGHVSGLEALLRWMHPLRGNVPLSELIPLAETTGYIETIGGWVLDTACAQARDWMGRDPDLPPVSINLSQREFANADLADTVKGALDKSSLPADMLEIEITEGMLLRTRESGAILAALDGFGAGIVVDDFGKGHSSIAHLISLPIKAVKIDRTFIGDVPEPGPSQSICSAIIAMSRELGITVIAEGVESAMQLEFLREHGCDAVQGFLYSEPMPAPLVPDFINACRNVAEETGIIDLDTVRQRMRAAGAG